MADWFSDHAPAAAPAPAPAATSGGDWFATHAPEAAAPDFKGSSVPAYQTFGEPAKDEGLEGFVRHIWSMVNPVQLGQLLPFPKAAGGSGTDHPLALDPAEQYAPNFLVQMKRVRQEGDRLWDKGEHAAAAAKYLESVIPMFGPMLSHMGNEAQQGKGAAVAGDAVGLALGAALPHLLPERPAAGMGTITPPTSPALSPRLTPEELASNAFMDAHGIPKDAATATGSKFVRGVQKVAGESLLGSGPAERAVRGQTEGLTRVGNELADQVKPGAVTPEQGGSGVAQSITDTIESLRGSANMQYGKAREIEALPEHAQTIQTAPLGSTGYRALLGKLTQGWRSDGMPTDGGVTEGSRVAVAPTHPELYTMRQIEAELEAQPYQRGKLVQDDVSASTTHYARGSANADVYHEIQQAAGTDSMTGAEMRAGIARTLESGEWNAASKAAYRVAQKRVQQANGGIGRGPRIPEEAPILGKAEQMALPVDVSDAKAVLEPLHTELRRANELTPLQGDLAGAYRAVDTLVNGPDHAPLSVADAARSSLLKLARTDDPLFRTRGQGVASKAAEAIDAAIQEKAATIPELQQALEGGRGATKAKYDVGKVRDLLPDEPVRAFDKLTAPRDGNIDLLRQVQRVAPERMADLGRAKLQQWLDLASERGRFDHADRLYAEWQKLGPQTKRILFGDDPARVEALDSFFLTAKRLQENPNPSGTATTGVKVGEVVGLTTHPLATLPATLTLGGLSKILYSPAGVKALSEFMRASAPARKAGAAPVAGVSSAARTAAWARLVVAAKAEGVDLPKAADRDDPAR